MSGTEANSGRLSTAKQLGRDLLRGYAPNYNENLLDVASNIVMYDVLVPAFFGVSGVFAFHTINRQYEGLAGVLAGICGLLLANNAVVKRGRYLNNGGDPF